METTKESIKTWLSSHPERDRSWLAEQCGVSKNTVNNWLSTSIGIPSKALLIIESLMRADVDAEKPAERVESVDVPIRVSVQQFDKYTQAFKASSAKTLREWMTSGLDRLASIEMDADTQSITPFPPVSAVADDVAEYKVTTSPRFTVPLLRAAAGIPILADAEMIEHYKDLGPGRFLLELRGDSMEPRFQDRLRVVMRDKSTLKRPVLKYRELYAFVHEGELTFKQWEKDGNGNKVLRSLNQNYPDIIADESIDWIGWYDPNDNE